MNNRSEQRRKEEMKGIIGEKRGYMTEGYQEIK
jgi:hypothetical protein